MSRMASSLRFLKSVMCASVPLLALLRAIQCSRAGTAVVFIVGDKMVAISCYVAELQPSAQL